jgi:hypothetical protein
VELRTLVTTASAALIIATGFSATSQAADLGYTYGELRYLDVDANSGNDADGATAIGWYRLNESFFALGQVIVTDADSGTEAATGALGAGYIQPVNDQWDAVAIGTLRRTELDTPGGEVSENGFGAQLGLRGMPIPKLEARFFLNYVDVFDDDTSFFVSGDYWFSPSLAAGLAAEFGGDADTLSVGVRYSFGN